SPSRLSLRATDGFSEFLARLGRRLQQPQQHRVHALLNLAVVAFLTAHAEEDMSIREDIEDAMAELLVLHEQMQHQNDRVAAIACAAWLDDMLGSAIS